MSVESAAVEWLNALARDYTVAYGIMFGETSRWTVNILLMRENNLETAVCCFTFYNLQK